MLVYLFTVFGFYILPGGPTHASLQM